MTFPNGRPQRRKRTTRQKIAGFLVVGLIVLIPFALDYGTRLISAPWSIGLGGRPTLTGDWLADMTLDDGTTGTLFIHLGISAGTEEGYWGTNLNGSGRYCLGPYRGELDVWGAAERDGTISELRFRPLEDNPVLLINNASGSWTGETLTINATTSFEPTGVHIFRSDVPSPALTLVFQPGSEETLAACD